jgi:hypothetical protein
MRRWAPMPRNDWEQIEAQVRHNVPVKEDFIRVPFPQIASASKRQIVAAVEQYKREAAIIDPRLAREVTLVFKGAALSDLCDQLQAQTGIPIAAGRSVADEKATIFCEKMPLRQVMREINRLFGDTWLRSGKPGEYKYELDQALRSQLAEEELRNHDRDAAVLALDREMQKCRPYVGMSYDELQKLAGEGGETGRFLLDVVHSPRWCGMQLYYRLTPADRRALFSGQELVFRPDTPNPERRLPAEWSRPLLMCAGPGVSFGGRYTELVDLPAAHVSQARLRLYRSEGGQLLLSVRMTAVWNEGSGEATWDSERLLATGRSPSVANPDNARANTALRGRPPLDRVISLELNPSCPAVKSRRPGDLDPNLDRASLSLDRSRPYALSSDVWEAIHRATGVPIIADFYTRLYPLDKLTIERRPLFDALCAAGDALGARWTTDGGYLLCRSTSYFWDKLAEVPNRYLQRWVHDRDASGGLPLTDFLEMATMSDEQLDSAAVAEGIEHFWGLREWVHLGGTPERWMRQHARLLAMLTPEQLRRTFQPQGLPFKELTPAQQQEVNQVRRQEIEAMERQGSRSIPAAAAQYDNVVITAAYIPAGWYAARVAPPMNYVGGRTADEAAAAARHLYSGSSPPEVRRAGDGYFIASLFFFINKG